MSLPGTSRLILVPDKKYPRYSEADVIKLQDGRLLLAVARKDGASDFAKGTLVGTFSRDRGLSWDDEQHVIQGPFDDVGDLMSVSFCRSPRGVHLFFLGRGPNAKADTRIYQMISGDEGKTWGAPIRVSTRAGYHVVNNARVIRTSKGRMIVPSAHLAHDWETQHDRMGVYCLYSDDDGQTWKHSNDLSLGERPLMEPGVAQCADGTLYMTIRTKEGVLYEARSKDDGATWTDFGPTKLPSYNSPSTVTRDPKSNDLWMFWINRPTSTWKQRTPLSFASSRDHGRTWSAPRDIENDPKHSYGYVSVTLVDNAAVLTYYDWEDRGQPSFQQTGVRQRSIPLEWLAGKPTPPALKRDREQPGNASDQAAEVQHVFRHRGFHLRLHSEGDAPVPHWQWSHDGVSWANTRTPCIALGDAGTFDCRMIRSASVTTTERELIWLYRGSDGTSDQSGTGKVRAGIGRATLALSELDAWLDSLPQP